MIKTHIFEFNGLPGSGKSTITKKIIDNQSDESVKLYDIKNTIMYNRQHSLKSLKTLKYFLFPQHLYMMFNMMMFMISNKCFSFKNFIRVLKILKLHDIYQKLENQISVCDQGIIQYFISILHAKRIKRSKHLNSVLKSILDNNNYKLFFLETVVDINEVQRRIGNRDKRNNDSRLDNADELSKEELLITINYNLESIRTIYKAYTNKIKIVDASKKELENSLNVQDFILDESMR